VDPASAFRIFWILQEKSPGGGRGFFMRFMGVFGGGFGKMRVFGMVFCGELMVDSW
jgi:hypothetical protein